MNKFQKSVEQVRFAFTLAEVLITLVVIGVIAAITVPNIMQNTKRTQYAAKLKKFYSAMSNAVKLSEINSGTTAVEWAEELDWEVFIDNYLAKYMNYIKKEEIDSELVYHLNDSSFFSLSGAGWISSRSSTCEIDFSYLSISYDINGEKKPNLYGRDKFNFFIVTPFACNNGTKFSGLVPYIPTHGLYDRAAYIEACEFGEGTDWFGECSAIVANDAWEFKKDYPFKL